VITFDELNTQNHEITELSNVLHYLLSDRGMCDTQVTCDLFFDFVDKVTEHLDVEDSQIYPKLLNSSDLQTINTARNFMSGGVEIKRLFADYLKKWCGKQGQELRIKDHEEFVRSTGEMFSLVLNRIQKETEHLYPLVRKVNHQSAAAA